MTTARKWTNYDIARSRLLREISKLDDLIDYEQSASTPNVAKIDIMEREQSTLIDQSDMLSANDLDLTSRIASPTLGRAIDKPGILPL